MGTFREHTLSSGRTILGGKDETSNDELVHTTKRTETMLHTTKPGSPFVRVGEKPTKKELYEAAIFCAKYSQDWRDNKQNVKVGVFQRAHMKKGLFAKKGSWNVTKETEKIHVKKTDIITLEKQLQQNQRH